MRHNTLKLIIVSLITVQPFFSFNAYAKDSDCTDAAIAAADAYDPGSSEVTNCIEVRKNFDVVIAWNSNGRNGKIFNTTGATVGQQVVNARNLVRDYENNYDMSEGDEYDAVAVAYGAGLGWVLIDSEQANQDMVNSLLDKGVKIYACQNTMKAKGKVLADLLPGVEIVSAGVSAVVDFQNQKFVYLNP